MDQSARGLRDTSVQLKDVRPGDEIGHAVFAKEEEKSHCYRDRSVSDWTVRGRRYGWKIESRLFRSSRLGPVVLQASWLALRCSDTASQEQSTNLSEFVPIMGTKPLASRQQEEEDLS